MKKNFKDNKFGELPHMGTWEIAQKPELFFGSILKVTHPPTLTAVVHEESHFILGTHVSLHDDTKNSGTLTLMKAVNQHKILPETLHVRDRKLFDELEPFAEEFDFNIQHVHKLKAIPQVFREMTRVLRQK